MTKRRRLLKKFHAENGSIPVLHQLDHSSSLTPLACLLACLLVAFMETLKENNLTFERLKALGVFKVSP
jgi:hypothetical protein